MSEKNKAISIVSLVLLLLSLAFLILGIRYSNKIIDHEIQLAEDNINQIILSLKNFSIESYKKRVEKLIRTEPLVLNAFAQHDRELLFKQVLSRYNFLKKENKYFHIIHFHLADGTTLLRMHNPDMYGDNLIGVRPIIDAVHKTKKPLTGYEAGRHGIYFRIVYPIFFQEKYIGAVEFGTMAHEVIEMLKEQSHTNVTSFFHLDSLKKDTSIASNQKIIVDQYAIVTHDNPLFKCFPKNFSLNEGDQKLNLGDKNYIVHVHSIFKNYQGKAIGGVVVFQDITDAIMGKQNFIVKAILFTVTLFLISFLVLYFTFGKIIDKLIQAKKRASEAEQTWERTFDAMPDQISILDHQHQITHANMAMAKSFGIPANELINSKCYKLTHGTDAPPSYCPHVKLLQDHQPHIDQYFDEHLQRHFSVSVAPLENQNGIFFGSIHIVRDITDESEAKIELQEEKNRVQNYLDIVNVMVVVLDSNQKVRLINNKGCELLGYQEKEIIGKNWFQHFIPERMRDEIQQVANQLYSGSIDLVENYENTILCKNGEERHIAWHNTFIQDDGKIIELLSSGSDITELKNKEKEKAELEGQLRQAQKMESIGTLAGGIAHDFNNILTAISGYTELSRLVINKPEMLQQHIAEVLKATTRAKDLVQQILTFSRKNEQKTQALQISLVIKEALKLLRSSLPSTIDIKQNINSDELVLADPTQIHQIVMNICTNAYHAMRKTGGTLKVSLKVINLNEIPNAQELKLGAENYLQLSVSDTGTGMDEETKDKIFDPYFTTKALGEGTGLGMAVVHGIVKNYNGAIRIHSEIDKGTSFYIYLPIHTGEQNENLFKEKEIITTGGTETIMLVDDDIPITTFFLNVLAEKGYAVHTFSNGVQAYQELQQNPKKYDLIITDMTMPFMNGAELAQKAIEIRSDLPVILCTGHSDNINRDEALAMGIKEFCKKPINSEQLLHATRKVLDTAKLESEYQ